MNIRDKQILEHNEKLQDIYQSDTTIPTNKE